MPDDLNVVCVVGRLTRDPEWRDIGDSGVLRMRLAVNRRAKVGGEWTDKAHFFDADMWGARAAGVANYLHQGSRIALSGHLEFREWTAKDGSKRNAVQIMIESLEFMDPPQQKLQSRDEDRGERIMKRDVELVPGRSDIPTDEDDGDDDIPFVWRPYAEPLHTHNPFDR